MATSDDIPLRDKLGAIYSVAKFRPIITVSVVASSVFVAILEGIGLSFVLPIIKHTRGQSATDPSGIMSVFVQLYEYAGIPFTLETTILGVGMVMTIRYVTTWFTAWLRAILQTDYEVSIKRRAFESAIDANIRYFDDQGSDEILNAIITQSQYASQVITKLISLLQTGLISFVYISIAFYIAAYMTIFAGLILGIAGYLSRYVFEPGFSVGDRVAEANERIQEAVQAGTQGIRDVKVFNMGGEIYDDFDEHITRYADANVKQQKNSAGINNFNRLIAAVSVFMLVYVGIEYISLDIGTLGVFLFAMFRLSPRVSSLSDMFYRFEAQLPHLVRTQEFIREIEANPEPSGQLTAPEEINRITFDDVSFSYNDSERVLDSISFKVEKGESIAFVGQSGAGKSTIISLMSRLYEPDSGEIRVNGQSLNEFDLQSWREQVAVVRQQPFLFNDTLRYNISVGDRTASQDEIERVAEIARVTEFIEELPEGYDTQIGDNGIRLSGGQKQRVALARALLKDAEVLMLDEATSDLDTNIENEVKSAIESINGNHINITVAHRLSTVKNADRIYTVERGKITETGTHKELLGRGGKYAELYQS